MKEYLISFRHHFSTITEDSSQQKFRLVCALQNLAEN